MGNKKKFCVLQLNLITDRNTMESRKKEVLEGGEERERK
jgi:hypothetical protein